MDRPLRGLPLAVIDIEATGLDDESRIVEIAVVHVDIATRGLPRVAFKSRVNPGIPMHAGASRVTGITDEDLADEPPWEDVAPLALAAMEGRIPCAFNVPADFGWLQRECARVGLEAPDWTGWLCALVLTKVVDRYERSKTQTKVAERRGIAVDAHGAAGDAVTTALLMEGLFRETAAKFDEMPSTMWPTLGDLMTWQREASLGQEVDFVEYLLRTHGPRADPPESKWHDLAGLTPPFWPERQAPVGLCLRCRTPATYAVANDGEVLLTNPDGSSHECNRSAT